MIVQRTILVLALAFVLVVVGSFGLAIGVTHPDKNHLRFALLVESVMCLLSGPMLAFVYLTQI